MTDENRLHQFSGTDVCSICHQRNPSGSLCPGRSVGFVVTDHRGAELEAELAALRAELDLYRDAEKDLKGATIAKQFRDEAVSLRAELEAAETLRKSANAEIARLAAELETANRKLENAIVLCEGDRKRHTAEHAAQVRQAEELRAELETARSELAAGRAEQAVVNLAAYTSLGGAEVAVLRAVAFEEATRVLVRRNSGSGCSCVMGEDTCWHSDVREIRALAPLDPALCVVARGVLKALSGEHEYSAMDSTYHRPECRKCAALKALEEWQ